MRSRELKKFVAEFEDVDIHLQAYTQKEALGILLRRVESGDEFSLSSGYSRKLSYWQVHDDKYGFPKMFRIP